MYNNIIPTYLVSVLHSITLSLPSLIKSHYPELILSILSSLLLLYRQRWGPLPINFPIIGMLPALFYRFNHLHDALTEILAFSTNQTFLFKGPVYLGPRMLITCNPDNIHHILSVNYKNYPKGHDFSEIFDFLGEGIFCADGESWLMQRRLAQALMVNRGYKRFVLGTTREIAEGRLVPLLDRWAETGEVVNLEKVFKRTTFDITCISSFETDLCSLSADFPVVDFSDAVDAAWQATIFRQLVPMSIWKLLRRIGLGEERKLAEAVPIIDNFIMQQISKRREELSKRSSSSATEINDLLTSYIAQSSNFDDKFLKDTALTLLIAGKDAFGITLTWFFYLVFKHPRVEKGILEELNAKKFNNIRQEHDLSSMIFLHATLCEVMRLYPPVAFERKEVLHAEELPSGLQIEPRTAIIIPLYAMGRMRSIWGNDCLEFKPERWISETGRVKHVPAYKFPVFNAGPRSCIGKEIGLTQLKMVAAEVIMKFKVEVIKEEEVVPENSVFMGTKNGMCVRVRKRGA